MANTTIPQLPLATSLDGTEQLQIVQGGTSKRTTISAASSAGGKVTSVGVSGGVTGLTTSGGPITSSGTITIGGTLAITSGGTNATTVAGARVNILPSYTGNAGKVLAVNSGATDIEWVSAGGTVTSVAALTLGTAGTDLSSTVANSTTTPVITLNVPTASATNRGALNSTDWSTFNNKQASLVSGTNIKTVGGASLLGSGDVGTIGVGYGGTGVTSTPTDGQLLIGNGTGFTLATLTAGTNITITNTSGGISIAAAGGGGSMIYPGAGIANSTGSAWGTSYTTTGSGTVVALATSPTFVTGITSPLISGGSLAASNLIVQSTSGAGTSDYIAFRTASQSERMRIDTNGRFGFGTSTTNAFATFTAPATSAAAWTTTGINLIQKAATFTDTSSTGTVASARINSFDAQTLAASSTLTVTDLYGTYFTAPIAGTNVTGTNKYSIGAEGINNTGTLIQVGSSTFLGSFSVNNTTTNVSFGSLTSGTWTAGGTSGTGTITLGRSTVSQQTDIQAGITASGSTKTINIGTNGASGSNTQITLGAAAGNSNVNLSNNTTLTFISNGFNTSLQGSGSASQSVAYTLPAAAPAGSGYVLSATTGGVMSWIATGGTGTVTSVSFTGGIITVANPTTTPAFTVAGTSGGIPYFSSASTWATSAALAANSLVVGGGAGASPATVTTGTGVVTALGVNTGSAGAFVVNGGALGTPSSGTVTNLTGTASININGTVGATTPSTGAFTTATASTSVTSPIVNGGSGAASSLTLQSTSGAGTSDYIAFNTASQSERMRIDTSGRFGFGTSTTNAFATFTAPATSAAAWTTSGINLVQKAATFTDTTSAAGTVADIRMNQFDAQTLAATNAITVTNLYGAYFTAPVAGTNVTGTAISAIGADSIRVAGGVSLVGSGGNFVQMSTGTTTGQFLVGNSSMTGLISLGRSTVSQQTDIQTAATAAGSTKLINIGTGATASGAITTINLGSSTLGVTQTSTINGRVTLAPVGASVAAWTTSGIGLVQSAATFTDTSSSGTVAAVRMNNFDAQTLAASSVMTATDLYGTYFTAPVAGTNVTATNRYAIGSDSIRVTGTASFGGSFGAAGGTFSAAFTLSTTTSNINLGTSQTSGTWTAGGTAGTATMTLGQSTASQQTDIQAGVTASGSTKTINIGTNAASGATSAITIGSATLGAAQTTTINGRVPLAPIGASVAAWTTTTSGLPIGGVSLTQSAATFTDTTSTGTVTNVCMNYFGAQTLAASSAMTATAIYGTYFTDPQAGANVTATTRYALGADGIRINNAAVLAGNTTVSTGTISTFTVGATNSTGAILIGQSTVNQTVSVGTGVTASGSTKTINIGTNGASGSTTAITVGSSVSGATSTLGIYGSLTSSDLVDAVGYKGMPQNSQSSSYTLALSDMGKMINITTGGVIIPANPTPAFPVGSTVIIYNNSSSSQTISITTDTMYLAGTATTGSRTLAQRGLATVVKVAATTWVISGAGVT